MDRREMTLDEYQAGTLETASYPIMGPNGLVYPIMGLLGEAGELADKFKKVLRDSGGLISEDVRAALVKELGDVLWYAARVAGHLDADLSEVAAANLAKLRDRKARGVICGSGDDR